MTTAFATVGLGAQPAPEEARRAQARFERTRRAELPWTLPGRGGCDERLGRMCMTHDGGSPWEPRSEPATVTRAREELLRILGRAGEKAPEDEWILGQRIRYLAEADRWVEAAALARTCQGRRRWVCHGLTGFTLHGLGRYPEAQEAFFRAVETMPAERRRKWESLRALADRPAGTLAAHLGMAPEVFVETFWRLADPYLLAPGNDRRTAHGARLVMAGLLKDARNPYNLGWGSDLEELLVRYGWEIGWERRAGGEGGGRPVVGHHDPRSRRWVPPGEVLEEPGSVRPGSWVPEKGSPRSTYAPPYAPHWVPMEAQLARLRRDSGLLLVASFRLSEDPSGAKATRPVRPGGPVPRAPAWAGRDARPEAGLFLVPAAGGRVLGTRLRDRTRAVLTLRAPPGEYLASVEGLDPAGRRGGWLRAGVRLEPLAPGVVALSDLLILDAEGEPRKVEEALARMASRPTVPAAEPLVVAWEAYGLRPGEGPVTYELTLTREGRGFLRRVGGWLGLVDDDPPVTMGWSEGAPEAVGARFRALSVDVPDLEPGPYRLRLSLSVPGRDHVVSDREVEVVAALRWRGGEPAAGRGRRTGGSR